MSGKGSRERTKAEIARQTDRPPSHEECRSRRQCRRAIQIEMHATSLVSEPDSDHEAEAVSGPIRPREEPDGKWREATDFQPRRLHRISTFGAILSTNRKTSFHLPCTLLERVCVRH